ncbi:MAG: YigZ family protein [Chitinophagaceae bacterium]|nr:YigZ family protein [Bacteroidota bacterium]MCC6258693.1 YigZ family protein [Chitinophagaceae bacterium]MCW5916085.1 YigZ family protein [Ferruginibacter sp.]
MERDIKAYYFDTIGSDGMAEFKDRGSRFIAFAFPIGNREDFKMKLQEIKSLHPKASHYCFAFRIGTSGDDFRVSDDGEPSGSAGRPILGQIDSRKIKDCGVVVVRYFGGTQLGIPGLIKAYKTSAALVLQTIPIVQMPVIVNIIIEFPYLRQNEVMQLLKQVRAKIVGQEMQLFCKINASIPLSYYDEVVHRLQDLQLNFQVVE